MKMTLAKALRVKNRLVSKLQKMKNIVSNNNSYVEPNPSNHDIAKIMEEIVGLTKNLVELKTAVSVANKGIARQLHELEELKSTISFLETISVREGVFCDYGDVIQTHKVVFKDTQLAAQIEKNQNMIEHLQDEINQFNFNTMIEVNFEF
jgi:hypothetical protein